MKRLYYFLAVLMISTNAFSQMLTIDQAIAIRTKSIAAIEDYLTQRKWSLLDVQEPTDSKRGVISFSYNKVEYTNKAEGFVTLFYYLDPTTQRLIYQAGIKVYQTSISRLKALGYKLVSTNVADGSLTKVYQLKKTTIEVVSSTYDNDELESKSVLYQFAIYDTDDYKSVKSISSDSYDSFEPVALPVDSTFNEEEKVDRADSKRDKAKLFFDKEDYKSALPLYLECEKTNNLNVVDYFNIAFCYSYLGNHLNAAKYSNKFLEDEPEDLDGLAILSYSYEKLNRIKDAIRAQKRLCELSGTKESYVELAWYYILEKQFVLAYHYINIAQGIYIYSDKTVARNVEIKKGHILLLSGFYEEAKQVYLAVRNEVQEKDAVINIVKRDYEALKKLNVINPNFEKILALLRK